MSKTSLDRILQSQGFGSRRYCRQLVEDGAVLVNGTPVTDWQMKLEPQGLQLRIFEEDWPYRERVYLALNKPAGIECSRKPSHHPGVMSLLPEQFSWRDVQAVGRLDHDTTGLLLLSDDGAFIHRMTSPRHHVPKVYLARTAEPATQVLVDQLLAGVQLHDEPAPLRASIARLRGEHEIEIVLEQGKYHQVKRMIAAAGNHCSALHRVAIGELTLAGLGLESGQWCYLEPDQLALLERG